MTLAIITNETLSDIADAIRDMNGGSDAYTPSQMPDAIRAIRSGGTAFPPEAVTGIASKIGSGKVGLKWDDPVDTTYLDYEIAEWESTRIVRKAGSAPTGPSDGTVVGDFATRDQYKSSWYVDSGLDNGTTYHYGFFPKSAAGAYRVQASEIVTAAPSALGVAAVTGLTVSGGNALATLTWSDPSDIADTDTRYGTKWAKTVIVRKAGSAPTSPSDGTVVVTENTRNQYKSAAYTDSGLANGTKYFYAAFAVSSDGATSAAVTASVTPTAFDPSSVTWANGSWDNIATMLDKHYTGEINISDYWKVGDSRSVSLAAMAATGVGESHVAQTVEWVIADFDKIPLATKKGTRTNAAVVFTQKNFLANGTNGEWGYMNSSNTNANGWDGCARRTWCNNVYKAALPSGLQGLLKQVNIVTANGSSTTTATSKDYIFLPAAKEVFGTATNYANATAESSLSQWKWFETAANRIKKAGASGSANYWWERSPYSGVSNIFCCVYTDGTAYTSYASGSLGVAPCGCI